MGISADTVGQTGEFALIAAIGERLGPGEGNTRVTVPLGDDAAEVAVPSGRVLVTTDVLVDGRHFRRGWSGAHDIGRRAAAQSLSDVNAMGGTATVVTVGLAVPAELETSWVLELAEGLAAECAEVDARVVGGDVTASETLTIAVTALGEAAHGPVLRSGARPGDVVAVSGRLGWAAAGLAVLGRGFRSPRAVVEAYRRPEVPYPAGPQAAALGASSMVDVSDGLLADVGHVAEASGVAIDVHTRLLEVAEPLQAVASALGSDPLGFVLTGGDDHALVATFADDVALPEGWRVIGAVAAGDGVTVDGSAVVGETGFRHF